MSVRRRPHIVAAEAAHVVIRCWPPWRAEGGSTQLREHLVQGVVLCDRDPLPGGTAVQAAVPCSDWRRMEAAPAAVGAVLALDQGIWTLTRTRTIELGGL